MTDRTYSPSGWGGVPITRGGEFRVERTDYCTDGSCDHVYERDCSATCGHAPVACDCAREGGSPDLPIPAEAREAAAEAIFVHQPHMGHRDMRSHCSCGEDFKTAVERQRHAAEAVLAAALPHLRSLQVETQVEVGRLLGRKEAAEEAEQRLTELAHRISPSRANPTLGIETIARYLRDIGKPATAEGA